MAPSSSPPEANSNSAANFVSNCLLSSAFHRTPLTQPPFIRHSKPNCLQNSISSTLNSITEKLFSFTNDFHNICQLRFQNLSTRDSLSMHNFAAILPGDSVAGIVAANGVYNFLNIYNTIIVVRLVLTWFPNAPPAIVSPLSTLCDPYLNVFRGLIPPLGGTLDLSPILAFLVLNALTSSAQALPAELPVDVQSRPKFLHLTMAHKKWLRRVSGKKSDDSSSLN
ncbi:hypothetical protein ACHQM5_001670 [Ranunculus cassubicifolius]